MLIRSFLGVTHSQNYPVLHYFHTNFFSFSWYRIPIISFSCSCIWPIKISLCVTKSHVSIQLKLKETISVHGKFSDMANMKDLFKCLNQVDPIPQSVLLLLPLPLQRMEPIFMKKTALFGKMHLRV
jgi:hypothetical protein